MSFEAKQATLIIPFFPSLTLFKPFKPFYHFEFFVIAYLREMPNSHLANNFLIVPKPQTLNSCT